jgi:hypothetical protein
MFRTRHGLSLFRWLVALQVLSVLLGCNTVHAVTGC